MNRHRSWSHLLILLVLPTAVAAGEVRLETLDLSHVRQGWGEAQADRAISGQPLSIGGVTYERGVGTHAESGWRLRLDGKARRFIAMVGVDDAVVGAEVRMEFLVLADGRAVWRSGVMRPGQKAKEVRVDLRRVLGLDLVVTDGEDGDDHDHANWCDARITFAGKPPVSVPFRHTLWIDPGKARQTIRHFGASDAWTVQTLRDWKEADRARVADLLFTIDKGIGLSGWRFNIGEGKNPAIRPAWRSTESFEVAPGKYDWSRQEAQRWFLAAAKARGVRHFTAFSLSPPARLTRSGKTHGSDDGESTNLRKGGEADYARYLADILEHFEKREGIAFHRISPVNEPQYEWIGGPHAGNRASNADLVRIYGALDRELRRRGLTGRILGPEGGHAPGMLAGEEKMGLKYGEPYAGYLPALARSGMKKALGGVLAGHSYWSDGYAAMVRDRRALREALDEHPGWEYRQTEYCILRGPRGESGQGRDLGMTMALWVARIIHLDLCVAEATAWDWWLALSRHDYKDGLVYIEDDASGGEQAVPSKTLWALGHWSRFVRPGMVRVETTGANHGLNGLLASAFVDREAKRLVVVLVNPCGVEERVDLRIAGEETLEWRSFATSEAAGRDHLEARVTSRVPVPPRSIVTLTTRLK